MSVAVATRIDPESVDRMIGALRLLADEIRSPDDIPAMCLRDAADMIEALRVDATSPDTILQVTIPAVPVAQPRGRATSRGGKARIYSPTRIKTSHGTKAHPIVEYKLAVRHAVMRAYGGQVLDGPLRLDLVFVMPRPASMIWKTKPMPRMPHIKKPDRDNLDKAVMDALTGVLWRDDAQVCSGNVEKWIAAWNESPHVELTLSHVVRPVSKKRVVE